MDVLEREEPLARLAEALASAAAGQGRMAAIAGEAGAGKTTLVEAFTANHPKARLLWGACENLATPEPLLPLRDMLRGVRDGPVSGGRHTHAFEALLHLLDASKTPSILVLEDVHWADAATLDMVRFLARRIGRTRALALITYRQEEAGAGSALRQMLGEAPARNIERITLEPLSLGAVSRLAQRKGRAGEEIFSLTGGNPFLVTEILAVEDDATPESVRDATLARAERLPEDARRLLDAASIFPRRARLAIIDRIAPNATAAAYDACLQKGMLILEEDSVRFRHELARRAIEAFIPAATLRAMHERVVSALMRETSARASEIAHHAERGGDLATFVRFARRACEEAAEAGAYREGANHLAAVLKHRGLLAASETVEILERHAQLAWLTGSVEEARASMREAAQMRRESGEAVALGRDLTRLCRIAWMCGRRSEAEACVSEAIKVLGETHARTDLAWAYSHQCQLDMLAFKLEDAIAWGERAIAIAEEMNQPEIVVHALASMGLARLQETGPGASRELERSLDMALARGDHDHVERASCNLTCSAYWRRDFDRALACIERGAAYAAERDLVHWEAFLRGWRAMIWLDQGRLAEAEQEAERVAGWRTAPPLFRFAALIALARARIRRGEPDADEPLETARQVSRTLDELQRRIYVAVVDAERAWLDPAPAAHEAAIADLRAIQELASERGARWVAEDAALWLAALGADGAKRIILASPFREMCEGRWRRAAEGWRARGCPFEEALALAAGDIEAQVRALHLLDAIGAAPAAAKLRREMRARGVRNVPRGPTSGTRASPAGLTRRQTQVLDLLSEGLSNPEIADRLCISAKTVEHHVSAVMARLEASTRREAAAAARRRGLLPPS